MRHHLLTAFLLAAGAASASSPSGFSLDVLVDGTPRPEFAARGTVYVEALRGRDYALRLSNPTGTRVAVALSVDGLNTLDSRHTPAAGARKWVLAPYETVVIPGWQVSNAASRKFVFTGERGSYGAALGKTEDLGVIEAVFFREKAVWRETRGFSANEKDREAAARDDQRRSEGKVEERVSSNGNTGSPAAAPPAPQVEAGLRDFSQKSSSSPSSSSSPELSNEYAATGMGHQARFGVTRVDIDLESEPAAVVRLRYEFRPQLVALGVLPRDADPSRIARRERARGFEEFCPEVR